MKKNKFVGQIQLKGKSMSRQEYTSWIKKSVKFLKENEIKHKRAYRISFNIFFRKLEDMNLFLLIFGEQFEVINDQYI